LIVTTSNIEKINIALSKLAKTYELIGEFYDEEPDIYNVNIGDSTLEIPFPRDEAIQKVENFYRLIPEFETVEIIDRNKVITERFTQRAIASDIGVLENLLDENNFEIETEDNIKLRIVPTPILIGIGAIVLGEYDKFSPPCSTYSAVEIEYLNKKSRLSSQDEEELIKSYFFEIANKLNCGIFFIHVSESGMYGTREDIEEEQDPIPIIKKVGQFNQGMTMYLKANQHIDFDIKLLYFYKILEYFAPVVVRIKANEKLRTKLDSPNAINPNADFLQSIYQLTRKYDEDLKDKDLVKAVFRECIDVIDLFEYLPVSIKKRVKGLLKEQNISYDLKEDKISILANTIGGIVYSTRNSIVHAKSNYRSDNNECPEEDLNELNSFLKHACYSTIKWYNRLPNHLKIKTE